MPRERNFVYYPDDASFSEHHSAKSGLLSTCEELPGKTRMTILKRSGVALMLAGILLVLIYLYPIRSQQPAHPSKPHKITINWDKAPRAVSYNVYRRLYSSQTFNKVGTSNTNSYDDPGVQGGERYCYVVTSLDSNGKESDRSREICLTVPSP
jgi:hypothetical protein